jgi:hypothetical protein
VKLSATVTGSSQPFTYLWTATAPNGGTTTTSKAASAIFGPVYNSTATGNTAVYTVQVNNTCGVCKSANVTVQVLQKSAVLELATITPQSVLSGECYCCYCYC